MRDLVHRSELPHLAYPTGWFQVGWSHELAVGDVRPARYFNRDLVIYRIESGTVQVADAYCPHFGAHLGFGGTVSGDCIQCPFHGWTWDTEGRNQSIPYSEKINRSKQITQHVVREVGGLILMWHDPDGEGPTWEVPPVPEFLDESRFHTPFDGGHKRWADMRLMPQFVLENNADFAHFKYVHEWDAVPDVQSVEATDHQFVARYTGQVTTKRGESALRIASTSYGVGLIVARLDGLRDTVSVTAVTPVDELLSDVFLSVAVERLADDGSEVPRFVQGIRHAQLDGAFRQDIPIWENQMYNLAPPYPKEEARNFLRLRKWSENFYSKPTRLKY
ncbi:Rieske 2Fe-2S domain-containing protein [Georgenia ruanii]|uniref:Rieske-type oxygenase n=1 Tax=Georgenia ruanii TaxID=348442 RepID=A0A7J9V0Q9_9MICO|nr:Rieske 2Fe-2S domain-containing protein [Georgenia ruanii]MPV90469.1 Rieske 2Fe-2S domain-containing protein [Georgenia ruanii]